MYLRELHIKNLKLIEDFSLSFDRGGSPRMWTILLGPNGTAKSSILQAIALTAAGQLELNRVAEPVKANLRSIGTQESLQVRATYSFSEHTLRGPALLPFVEGVPGEHLRLQSEVTLDPDQTSLKAVARYEGMSTEDPLVEARSKNLPLWFVAGYGVTRVLPGVGVSPSLGQPSIERLSSLFDAKYALTSLAFVDYFRGTRPAGGPKGLNKTRWYNQLLKKALTTANDLLPDLKDVELRGQGGVRSAGDLQQRNRFTMQIGSKPLKVPAIGLSHGYQSTIAWISDLLGHVVLECDEEIPLEEISGLVLIDELDLHLHPTWQVVLVEALRKTFPQLQFVVSTHSPLILASVRNPDEVVQLDVNRQTGAIERINEGEDARLMTSAEIYRQFFGLGDIHPSPIGQVLRNYGYLAANPYRTAAEDKEMISLQKKLEEADVDPGFDPVPRRRNP